ncbi:EAL domain-containing response regulator [Nisaea sp.]|uniref:EAL domain-containing response regulator n=1 Tax=Nisaea sp. TaxID=2024842 RepID=UPI003B53018B
MTKIIVIEDDQDYSDFIIDAANGLGLDSVALSGRRALSRFECVDADIITLDLNMPEFDGIEVIRRLAKQDFKGGLILISGIDTRVLQSAATLARAHGLKVCGLMCKPVSLDELELAIGNAAKVAGESRPAQACEFREADIWTALESDQLRAYFQPKIDMASRRIKGAEALVRWNHPEKGILPPGRFLPAIESIELIDALSMRMLRLAVDAYKAWKSEGLNIPVAVNFEAPSFRDLGLPERVQALLRAESVEPDAIVIEVTETSVISDLQKSLDVLARIRMKGISLSVDDFGTGHSTFEQLRTIPFTELKIDRRFISQITDDSDARSIVRSMIELADRLGISCVAEGVESREEYELLEDFGCREVQGYFIAHPMPVNDATNWHKEYVSCAA